MSQDDLSLLCAELKMKPFEFEKVYCRRIDLGYGEKKLSLKETSVFDCIFWKDGCTVYNARPFMCRSYPFWDSMLASKTAWENASAYCPGCNKEDGMLYSKTSIEEWLRQEEEHKCIKN
ncbi:MAG: hypothetical protein Ta2F_05820 [Termitinemataceae bacterium]|nr:MAG: hypothetical protein Ta2F_05820 [Termitinemataceae bacterium]